MKILLSPAKLMSLETTSTWTKNTTPKFLDQAQVVMDELKQLSPDKLSKLMKISKDLAEMNLERNHIWNTKPKANQSLNAALAFKGEVYRGLDAETLSDDEMNYLNEHLFILSGLYGILKPSDKVMLYRLEMGSKLDVKDSKNLYGFWKETLTDYINSQTKKSDFILNLASNEYAKVLDVKKLKAKKIDVEFYDFKDGELKQIMVYFKQARGAMTRYCATKKVETLDEVKLFQENGYSFDEKSSTDEKLVFIR